MYNYFIEEIMVQDWIKDKGVEVPTDFDKFSKTAFYVGNDNFIEFLSIKDEFVKYNSMFKIELLNKMKENKANLIPIGYLDRKILHDLHSSMDFSVKDLSEVYNLSEEQIESVLLFRSEFCKKDIIWDTVKFGIRKIDVEKFYHFLCK